MNTYTLQVTTITVLCAMPLDYNLPNKINRAARENDEHLLDDAALVSETEITEITFIKNFTQIIQLLEALGELTLSILTEM